MQIIVTALQNFIHCAYDMEKGQKLPMPERTAKDLRAAGLVSCGDAADPVEPVPQAKQAAEPENKMLAAPKNKLAKNTRLKDK